MNSDFSSKKSMLKKLALTFFRQSIVTGIVFGFLISLSATPIHAWWFTDVRAEPLVTPVHQRGLVLSPLVQNILPEFILEPLSQVEVESPPSTAKTPDTENTATSSVSKIELSPVDKPNTTQQTTSYPSIVRQMLDAVNRERSKVIDPSTGRPLVALVLNPQLTKSAQDYAVQMQDQDFFSHESPDGTTFKDRNERAGYTNWAWMGENIAYGQQSVEEVIEDWMNSEGHKANILEPRARELGVGYVTGSNSYWVQEFGQQF